MHKTVSRDIHSKGLLIEDKVVRQDDGGTPTVVEEQESCLPSPKRRRLGSTSTNVGKPERHREERHREKTHGEQTYWEQIHEEQMLREELHWESMHREEIQREDMHREQMYAEEARREQTYAEEGHREEDRREETSRDGKRRDKRSREESSQEETRWEETSRAETSRAEASRAEASRAETSREDTSREDTSRDDTSRDDTSRDDSSRDESTAETSEDEFEVPVLPPAARRKRKYRFINRVRAQPRSENRLTRQRRAEADNAISENTSSWPCCKRLQCFRNADIALLRSRRTQVLAAPQQDRKRMLKDMLDNESKKFYFNRKQVCTFFLQNAFGFSKDLQRNVRGTRGAPSTGMVIRTPKITTAHQQRDIITSYISDLAELVGDKMPDAQETHLPFMQKRHVYSLLVDNFESQFPKDFKPPSFTYFVSVWNDRLKNIKVRKLKRFTKCTDCEINRAALVRWSQDVNKCQAILEEQKSHMKLVGMERAAYMSRMRRPLREPTKVCSIVIDGADQTSFGLPSFVHTVKATRGESIDVKLIGLLEHRPLPFLYLYTMTGQFETGANHIIETIHRWINLKARAFQLPPKLYVQLDNSSRENKNRYVLSYLECLVAWGVFVEIEVSFLPIGHTHCDIDQKFSCTAAKLRSNTAVTVNDLHGLLRDSYSPRPIVAAIKHVANISALLEQEKVISKVPNFSHYRFFKLSRSTRRQKAGTGFFSTCCGVKVNCDEEWKPLFENHTDRGFLLMAPDLARTPSYVFKKLNNKNKVLDRIDSEKGRIASPAKVQDLLCLVNEVYRGGTQPFEWNMDDCIESAGMQGKLRRYHDRDESTVDLTAYIPVTNVDYSLNYFVAVTPDDPTEDCPFWIGRIEKLVMNKYGDVAGLELRWYETNAGDNAFQGSYKPSYRLEGKRTIAWTDLVSTDTVFCQIDSLTRANKLGAVAVRRIQEVVKYKSFHAN